MSSAVSAPERASPSGAVEERALGDDVDAAAHRLDGLRLRAASSLGVEGRLDVLARRAFGPQRLQVLALVLEAAVEDELQRLRRIYVRRHSLPAALHNSVPPDRRRPAARLCRPPGKRTPPTRNGGREPR